MICIKYGYMSKMEYSCNLATDNHKLATNELDRQCHKPLLYSFQCTWTVWASHNTMVVAFHPNYKDPYSFFGQMTQFFPPCPNLDMLYSCFSSCYITYCIAPRIQLVPPTYINVENWMVIMLIENWMAITLACFVIKVFWKISHFIKSIFKKKTITFLCLLVTLKMS